MIVIKLNKANFEYDIYSLVKAFYPQEEIKLTADCADVPEQISFRLVITYVSNQITLQVTDENGTDERSRDVVYEDRRDTKNKLKQMVYEALSERTGKTLPWGTLTGIRPTKIPLKFLEEGKSKEEIFSHMKDAYMISEEKAQLAYDVAKEELDLLAPVSYASGYSLYIGIPFCPSTCLYCSFTSYPVGVWKKRMDEYLDGVFREIDFVANHLSDKTLQTIYIGGGTPTSLSAEQLDRLFTKIESALDLSRLLEFTVEAGRPDSITPEKLRVIHRHGIGRISINPQTMNQKTLDLIGRHHTVEQIRDSYRMAREIGIPTINMDLIVGLPGETMEDFSYTLDEVKKLNPDNLTVHSLAVKRSARLNIEWEQYQNYQMENSEHHMELAKNAAKAMGMQPYYLYRQKNMAGNLENIGFSRAGKACLYNILIMEEKQSIVALGAGSVCKHVTESGEAVERSENVKDVDLYLQRLDEMIDRKRTLFCK